MTNLVLFVADDMRHDHVEYMPNLRRYVQDRGTTFTTARCNLPLCQPSRVAFFSGQLSRDHGDLAVGFEGTTFDDHDNSVAAWAGDAGYQCGLFGKYINGIDELGGMPAPRGWSRWVQITADTSQEDFKVQNDRDTEKVHITGTPQTEYLAQQVVEFVEGATQPFFAYIAPRHPHEPFSPLPPDMHAWSNVRCREVPIPDASAKPRWIQDLAPLADADWSSVQQGFRGRLRELNAVDRMIGSVMEVLERRRLLDDTIVLFTSDNGVHQGEHRRKGAGDKGDCYEVSLRVPLLAAGPGFTPGAEVHVPVYSSQDLTATVVDVSGASPRLPNQAGTSLRAIAAQPSDHAQRSLLHEVVNQGGLTDGDGITTGPDHELGAWKLFRYPALRGGDPITDFEMYDLTADPDELHNLADQPAHRATRDRLEVAMLSLHGA